MATDLVLLVFVGSFAAMLSTAAFSLIAVRLHEKQLKWTLVGLKAITVCWPIWMCFGFKRKFEMWLLLVVAAPFNSNILPTLRSVYQQATPKGYEAALFSLCGVCTVAFTWIGSLVVAGFLAWTGTMRWGLLSCAFFVMCSMRFFVSYDPTKARADRLKIERGEVDFKGRFVELQSRAVSIG
jgi:MFS-type transporter involved in bile tolerance (Atg22 family)